MTGQPRIRGISVVLALSALVPIVLVAFGVTETDAALPISINWAIGLLTISALSATRPLDRSHPLLWGCGAMMLMYVAHPLAMRSSGKLFLTYRDSFFLTPSYDRALWLSAAGFFSLCCGFLIARLATRGASDSKATKHSEEVGQSLATIAARWAYVLLVLSVLGYFTFAVTSGVSITDSVAGGARRGNVTTSSAYLYLSPQLTGPAAMLLLYANHVRKRAQFSVVAIILVQVLLFVPSGQRLVLLTSTVPILMAWLFLKGRRMSAGSLVVVALFALVALISLRDLGGGPNGITLGESFSKTLTSPMDAVEEFFTGADTEMVDGLAIEMQSVPSSLPHEPGRTILAAVSAPVPSALWPGKPVTADGILNFALLGVGFNNASLAYGFVGELYYDSGLFGVCIGLALMGVLLQRLLAWRDRVDHVILHLTILATVPLVASLLRGSLALLLGRAFFTVGPLLLFYLLIARRHEVRRAKQGTAPELQTLK